MPPKKPKKGEEAETAETEVFSKRPRHLFPTYMHVAKNRHDSSRTRVCGLITFDTQRSDYRADYQVGVITQGGEKWAPLPVSEWPPWARSPA